MLYADRSARQWPTVAFPSLREICCPSIINYGIGWATLAKSVPQGGGVSAGPPLPRS